MPCPLRERPNELALVFVKGVVPIHSNSIAIMQSISNFSQSSLCFFRSIYIVKLIPYKKTLNLLAIEIKSQALAKLRHLIAGRERHDRLHGGRHARSHEHGGAQGSGELLAKLGRSSPLHLVVHLNLLSSVLTFVHLGRETRGATPESQRRRCCETHGLAAEMDDRPAPHVGLL